ncbi:MAG TPA: DUF3568 family protein [Deltaproteobacteria bacterium]|nr:DUF3568 family protein [Deltaproteobacteria bacterium]
MKKNNLFFALLFSTVFLFSGCAALVAGAAAAGASVGTYYYISGELKTDYFASFEKVWNACEKTIADMRGIDVSPSKEIARGKITAVINNEKVKINITYKSKDLTTVAIRVGIMGNRLSAQLLHDKIASHLSDN